MENNTENQVISVEDLNLSLTDAPEKLFIIDLMGNEEFEMNHIPGAVNIPVEELAHHLSEIPRDKTVILACRMGLKKSDMALEQLHSAGYRYVKKVSGGTSCWFENNKSA